MFRKQHLVVASGIAALAVMSAGVALAATGGGASAKGATIRGCENNRTHVLSVRRGRYCGWGFTAVSWSWTGPRL